MTVGGFKTLELNLVGWTALLVAGSVAGGLAALVSTPSFVLAAACGGALAAYGVARLADELRDRRRWSYIPVLSAEDASSALRSHEIPVLGVATATVRGRPVEYVAVRERDSERAVAMIGMPHESRRGKRRWYGARTAAVDLPPPGTARRHREDRRL